MTESLLAIIPIAALVGAFASFLTAIWRENAVAKREERNLKLEADLRINLAKLDALTKLYREVPNLQYKFVKNSEGRVENDLETALFVVGNLNLWVEANVPSVLSNDGRIRVETARKLVEEWLNKSWSAFSNQNVQPPLPHQVIAGLHQTVREELLREMDRLRRSREKTNKE